MLSDVALDVVDDLAALGDVERTALELDHLSEFGIIDTRGIERLPRHEVAIEITVRVGPAAEETSPHLVELAKDGARYEGAVFLELDLGLDAGLLPSRHGNLHRVHIVGPVARCRFEGRLEPARVTGSCQEPLRLLRVEVVESPALGGELIDGNGPVLEGGGNGWVGRATSLGPRIGLEHLSPV